jgi:hypothetical protein
MSKELEVPVQLQRAFGDLIEEQKNIDSVLQSDIHTLYAQWLWETGRNIVTSPLWDVIDHTSLVNIFCKYTKKKERYVWYAIKSYQAFPYTDWNEVYTELTTRYPDTPISERFFLSLVSGKDEVNEKGQALAPLHRGLKNAQPIKFSDLLDVFGDAIQQHKEVYVKIYIDDYQITYKLSDEIGGNENGQQD